MKKLLLLAICMIGFTVQSHSQNIAENAIGLRLGGSTGVGTELSYQRALSGNNRLEIDLGWSNRDDDNAFRATGIYQWVRPLDDSFNWFFGAGAGAGAIDSAQNDNNFFVAVAGQVGVEYDFDFPLLVSVDFRPEIGLLNYYGDELGFDVALGLRYQF